MLSLCVKFGDFPGDTRARTRGSCQPASIVKKGDTTLVRRKVEHVRVVGNQLSLTTTQHHRHVVLMAYVGWDV